MSREKLLDCDKEYDKLRKTAGNYAFYPCNAKAIPSIPYATSNLPYEIKAYLLACNE